MTTNTTNLKKLVYVPILHARENVGSKTGMLQGNDAGSALTSTLMLRNEGGNRPQADSRRHSSAVGEMWAGITAKIEDLGLPWNQTRIYQDGLPVCGRELEIVSRLAENGSWNHLLILNLLKKGAKLEGTENIDFLMREYDLLNILLMKNPGADLSSVALRAKEEYQTKSRELLKLRDEFILSRVKNTLQEKEVALVFMGVMHRLDKLLEKDFFVSYIIYRLPFHSVGAIYNA